MSAADFFAQNLKIELAHVRALSREIFAASSSDMSEEERTAFVDRAMREMERQFRGAQKASSLVSRFALEGDAKELTDLVQQFASEANTLLAVVKSLHVSASGAKGAPQ